MNSIEEMVNKSVNIAMNNLYNELQTFVNKLTKLESQYSSLEVLMTDVKTL